MIKRLYIDNFKSLVNFELHLQELTLLVGPNGVGKTSVLDVMFALRQLLAGKAKIADRGIFPTQTLTRWRVDPNQTIEIDSDILGERFRYRLEIEHDPSSHRARITLERLEANDQRLFEFQQGEVRLYRDDHSPGPVFGADWTESALARVPARRDNSRLTRFLEHIRKIVVCGLYPASFVAESTTEDAVLDRDARNFAAWYRHLLLERPDLAGDFTDALQDVIAGFRAIRLERVGLDTRALMVMFSQYGQVYELRFDELSDGQRALIALYSLVHLAAGQGYTLFLDEPDNYVALPEIQPWLMALQDSCGEHVPQAVLCSHHPELIDYLGPARGLLLRREDSGLTRAESLAGLAAEGGLRLSELVARGWQE